MKDQIERLLELYPVARSSSPFKGPHQVQSLFKSLQQEISELPIIANNPDLQVNYSYGKGNWADVPWIAILDSRLTTTTQDGTYIVLLFAKGGEVCSLKIGQGVTKLRQSLGTKGARAQLQRQATDLRQKFPQPVDGQFEQEGGDRLGRVNNEAALYEASTIYSSYYEKDAVPGDEKILTDLSALVDLYSCIADYLLTQSDSEREEEDVSRIWAISAGRDGGLWNHFLERGLICIDWSELGDLSAYDNRLEIHEALKQKYERETEPSNDALACFQFCREMSVGDIVIAKQGRKKILGMGVIESDYSYRAEDAHPNIRKVKWHRTDQIEWPGSGITIKTLTEMTSYRSTVDLVNDYLELDARRGRFSVSDDEEKIGQSYTVQSILNDGCFLTERQVKDLLATLKRKKNLILQGPPGTGKTWLAKRLAYALVGRKDTSRVRSVQFHPNLSYEDFVRGWRPSGVAGGQLQLVDGPFMEIVEDAQNSPYPHILVIEEINRGNPAQIFGELLTLLESDKRVADESLQLSYRRYLGERVHLPPNLFVIGTMNIADRSLAIVDMALRRRFAFFDMQPLFNDRWQAWLSDECGIDKAMIGGIESKVRNLNSEIEADPGLGPQFKIGHSFFSPGANSEVTDPTYWYQQIVETELSPLIREYWFDDQEKAEELIKDLAL